MYFTVHNNVKLLVNSFGLSQLCWIGLERQAKDKLALFCSNKWTYCHVTNGLL